MHTPPAASLFRRLVRWRARPIEPDPADLGTAFGMESSMMMTEMLPRVRRPRWRAWLLALRFR